MAEAIVDRSLLVVPRRELLQWLVSSDRLLSSFCKRVSSWDPDSKLEVKRIVRLLQVLHYSYMYLICVVEIVLPRRFINTERERERGRQREIATHSNRLDCSVYTTYWTPSPSFPLMQHMN